MAEGEERLSDGAARRGLARLAQTSTWLFAGRFGLVRTALLAFLGLNAMVRIGLLLFNGEFELLLPWFSAPILVIGAVFDFAAAAWWLPLFAVLATAWPASRQVPTGGKASRGFLLSATALLAITYAIWAFMGASEFVFWNEFSGRFNFIAVDYLIYTREVIGNIRESYDLQPLFIGISVAVALLLWLSRQGLRLAAAPSSLRLRARLGRLALFLMLPVVSFMTASADFKEISGNTQASQLAGNGYFEFWHAFRTNEIDYAQFYRTQTLETAYRVLRSEFDQIGPQRYRPSTQLAIDRDIVTEGLEKPLNVILISVESLSAEFMSAFGNNKALTPHLDRLAQEGMLFSHIYATGTRTVRGLEALTLSIPPTPGNSIVKRPDNDKLSTLGEVFSDRGYETLYIYGGYGYFDNMNAFFSGNGYTVIDRTSIPKEAIHHENIWGVADEDLFTLALDQIDQRAAADKHFFAHVMTTSNPCHYTQF